jgi:hypothetical protein
MNSEIVSQLSVWSKMNSLVERNAWQNGKQSLSCHFCLIRHCHVPNTTARPIHSLGFFAFSNNLTARPIHSLAIFAFSNNLTARPIHSLGIFALSDNLTARPIHCLAIFALLFGQTLLEAFSLLTLKMPVFEVWRIEDCVCGN